MTLVAQFSSQYEWVAHTADKDDHNSAGEAFPPATNLIALVAAFEAKAVAYCYWKSRRRVDRALAGLTDLDLLVAKNDRQRATEILHRQAFKCWPDAPGRDHPALLSFFGYNDSDGRISHIHIHFQLVAGHSLIRNFRLPIEERILARSAPHPNLPIRVLDPTDEALLLIIRANLDMGRSDPIALRRWSELKQKYADALTDLAPIVDRAELKDRAAELFSLDLADAIAGRLCAVCKGERPSGLRRAISRELSPFRMYGQVEASVRGAWRSALWVASGLNKYSLGAPRLPRRRVSGGALIALVGLDGSGKSTLSREIRRWLIHDVDVVSCYFGTGDGEPSLLFRPVKALSRLVARAIKTRPKGASHGAVSDKPPGPGYSALFAVWATAVAIDKWRKLVVTQRAINRGFIVVTDRYPQNEIVEFNDGPLLHRLPRCPAWLKRFEASIYNLAQRASPDLVIKLHVGPETVAMREPQMIKSIIDQRIAWLGELKFPSARIVSIDATRPLGEVHREAKREIWSVL